MNAMSERGKIPHTREIVPTAEKEPPLRAEGALGSTSHCGGRSLASPIR